MDPGRHRQECLCYSEPTRESIKNFASAGEIRKALLFFAKLPGVRNQTTTGTPCGMLYVEHFVKKDIFHGALWDSRPVHTAIQQNVIGSRIVAAELAMPASMAPANVRSFQLPSEIPLV